MSAFNDFGFIPTLLSTLTEKGLASPTEIQLKAIPPLLSGQSVVGVAETGSGKTIAYALPVLHALKNLEASGAPVQAESSPRACVVVPTRELGEQVSRVFKTFTHATRLRVRSALGGTTLEMARRNIQGPFEVLVATPGRMVQLLNLKLLRLNDVRTLIFDEADQMLDQGFLPDADRIAKACPPNRQLALFTATLSPSVEKLVSNLFKDAVIIRSGGSHRVVSSLKTLNKKVIDGKRLPVLEALLKQPVKGGTILFANTRAQCDQLSAALEKLGHSFVLYRGEMDKVERRKNLKAFRDGTAGILISTDLASRGLDIEHVGRVINVHLPQQMENYIHRVGRTARAGRPGQVINLVTERDEPFMAKISALDRAGSPWPIALPYAKKVKKHKIQVKLRQ